MKVLFTPEVSTHIDFLIPFLYELGYFRNKEQSKKYFDELINKIIKYLPILQHHSASFYFHKFVNNKDFVEDLEYVCFSKNQNTIWYAFLRLMKTKKPEAIFI